MKSHLCCVLLALLPLAAGCGGGDSPPIDDASAHGVGGASAPTAPADVEGVYSVAVTNGANGCTFPNWQQGSTSTGIPLTVSQSGAHVTCTVDGVVGALVQLWLGSRGLAGEVSGDEVDLDLVGTAVQTSGACSYTIDLHVDATATGNALQGALVYTAATGGDPKCAAVDGCVTQQAFSGVRPPK